MTVSERRNYQVSALFSIILHLSLALIVFPMQLLSIPAGVEEVAVGIYELTDSQLQVVTADPEPEVVIEPAKLRPKPTSNQPKQVLQTSPKPNNGQPNQNSKPVENPHKGPISLGTGVGMVIGLGQAPTYPKNAENEGVEGEVLVRVLVKMDGALEQGVLKKPSGDYRLDNAAVKSVYKDWVFKPNTEDYYIDIMFYFVKNSSPNYKLVNSATRP